jgi:hypothetical protein
VHTGQEKHTCSGGSEREEGGHAQVPKGRIQDLEGHARITGGCA